MPATYTHHVFAKDVFKVLDERVKNKIDESKDIFLLFSKSFDIVLFAKPSLGTFAHDNNVNMYFEEIIKFIKDNNLESDSQVLAYLYGSICHYVLDSTAHPFIYYKGGKYLKDKKTRKYKGKHDYIEFMIDAIIYKERNNKYIYKENMAKELLPEVKFSNDLKYVINYAYLQAFDYKNGSKLFLKGINNYRFLLKYLMVSRFGIRKNLYKLIDKTNLVKGIKISNAGYYKRNLDYTVLNLEHKKWYYPVDKNISYHYSFFDLYDVAIEKARSLINGLDEVLNKDAKDIKKFLRELGDVSYYTGIKAGRHYPMKYFEF